VWQTAGEAFTNNFYVGRWNKARSQGDAAEDSKPFKPFVGLCLIVYFLKSIHNYLMLYKERNSHLH